MRDWRILTLKLENEADVLDCEWPATDMGQLQRQVLQASRPFRLTRDHHPDRGGCPLGKDCFSHLANHVLSDPLADLVDQLGLCGRRPARSCVSEEIVVEVQEGLVLPACGVEADFVISHGDTVVVPKPPVPAAGVPEIIGFEDQWFIRHVKNATGLRGNLA